MSQTARENNPSGANLKVYLGLAIALIIYFIMRPSETSKPFTTTEAVSKAHVKLEKMATANRAQTPENRPAVVSPSEAQPPAASVASTRQKTLPDVKVSPAPSVPVVPEELRPQPYIPVQGVVEIPLSPRCRELADSTEFVNIRGPYINERWHIVTVHCNLGLYEAKTGDSLPELSRHLTGSTKPWRYIWSINPQIKNPLFLREGETVSFLSPVIDPTQPTVYVVQAAGGETVSEIYQKVRGHFSIKRVRALNPDLAKLDSRLPKARRVILSPPTQ